MGKAQKAKGELDEQLRDYINEWRKQREKEEEELKRLKEKQAKRKEIRAEQEKKLNQQKKEEEERLRKEETEKKAKEAEEKKKSNKPQAREEEPKHPPAQVFKTQGKKLPKPKSNWRKRKRSPFLSESNPSMSITWTQTNLAPKVKNFGTPLLDLKPKSTILRKDKRGRTTTSKSSRKDRSNN